MPVAGLRRTGVALLSLLVLSACSGGGSPTPAAGSSALPALHGLVLPTTVRLPHAALLDTSGHAFDPAAHDDHAVTLLYTGYTRCQDICPTTMADIATALRDLPPSVARQVQVEFVTTDPAHDTPPVIRRWLARFSPSFVGLWGSVSQVQALSTKVGLPAPMDGGETHSTEVLAFVRGRGADVAWISGFTPADLVHDLPLLVAQAR